MSDFLPWEKVAGFMAELRDVGLEAKYLIRRDIGEETMKKRQFIIAMFASKTEIQRRDLGAIKEYGKYLLECNSSDSFHARERYILNKRIITLLNSPWNQKHGEARLLDPDGTVLSDILQKPCIRNEGDYLSQMKERFQLEFGDEEKPILLLFSYFIPCTLEDHQCARLINEYSKLNIETIFVAYQALFRDTDSHAAFEQMIGKKVKVVPKKYIEAHVNSEISRLLVSRHYHKSVSDYCLPRGWLPEPCEVDENVHKQLVIKSHKIDKRNDRMSDESMPYRVCKNRKRSYKSSKKCDGFADHYDDNDEFYHYDNNLRD